MSEASLSSLIDGDAAGWIDVLPGYQRQHVVRLLESGDALTAATIWLSNSGPTNTAPHGGARVVAERFYDNLLLEMQKLFCGDASYAGQRAEIANSIGTTKLVVMGGISAAVAPHVGVAAVVLIPAIALTMTVISNSGRDTICQSISEVVIARQGDG